MPFLRNLFLAPRLFAVLIGLAALAAGGYVWAPLLAAAQAGALALVAAVVADAVLLWRHGGVEARRDLADRLSNGDDNPIALRVRNRYPFPVRVEIRDEAPAQFQLRGLRFTGTLAPSAEATFTYTVRPTARGAYAFGEVLAYATGPLGLVVRRCRSGAAREVPVYPSILQMERYAFLATSDRLAEAGVKRVRRVGHSMAFEQVRGYVAGDDPRAVNWKATARRGALMVNEYAEERSQPVVVLLDTGRQMREAFHGLTLLDYAVNAALVLLNTALLRGDRAGLVAFGPEVGPVVPADRGAAQRARLLEALYRLEAPFLESDYEGLFAAVRRRVPGRALLVLFCNFGTAEGLRRQLPSLRALARRHVVVAVFFENVGLDAVRDHPAGDVEGVYVRAAVAGLDAEKRRVVQELERHGIQAVLARPEHVTVQTLNRYLEIKARGLL